MLILGIAGIGLAAAMFLDDQYPRKQLPNLIEPETKTQPQSQPTKTDDIKTFKYLDGAPISPVPTTVKEVIPITNNYNKFDPRRLREMYKQKIQKEKEVDDQEVIDAINSNAYIGSGSQASRRLYIQQQAYKKSRAATPIIPIRMVYQPDSDDEDEDEDDNDDEDLNPISAVDARRRSSQPTKTIAISKQSWETRDPLGH